MVNKTPTIRRLNELYKKLYSEHPHELLPLETSLPKKLRYNSRDKYRIIITMILSGRISDIRLTKQLVKLFSKYHNFDSFKDLSKSSVKEILYSFGCYDPSKGGNGARFWGLINLYFRHWEERITNRNIIQLIDADGYGNKFVKCIQAYCLGNCDVLPLDNQAFKTLQKFGLYTDYNIRYKRDADFVRSDIEKKLQDKNSVSSIDFHELLRFRGQAGKINERHITDNQRRIIIGWNSWRILCSIHRETIISLKWIYRYFVKDKNLSDKHYKYYIEKIQPFDKKRVANE